ncbi:MAG: hypothetical protein QM569_04080 [Acidovorax sp.]|uniref:hypothetical protein n=1 Tax=Acidovorax sp. TaxID=1872122 RepID=UPI0039E3A276
MAESTSTGTTVTTENGTVITVLVEPAPPDDERIQDMASLWGLFLVVAIVIFCMRKLGDLFSIPHND